MKHLLRQLLSRRTRSSLRFDWLRLKARLRHQRRSGLTPPFTKLHFGCGDRKISGWLNVDVAGSDFDVDLAAPLPWKSACFECVVSQQVIEHLEIESEALPLFRELARVIRAGGEFWLSCPDMEKVCRAYLEDSGRQLLEDRLTRYPVVWPEGMPDSQMINVMFHQGNEHKNLYDFTLLKWLLERQGFGAVERVNETILLDQFPEFPPRNDDFHALYVRAIRV